MAVAQLLQKSSENIGRTTYHDRVGVSANFGTKCEFRASQATTSRTERLGSSRELPHVTLKYGEPSPASDLTGIKDLRGFSRQL